MSKRPTTSPAYRRLQEGQITFEDVAEAFRLPILEASEKTGLKPGTLKRICKENGLSRWPYRKIQAGRTVEEIVAMARKEMAMRRTREATEGSGAAAAPGSAGSSGPGRPPGSGASAMRPAEGPTPVRVPVRAGPEDTGAGRGRLLGQPSQKGLGRTTPVFLPFAPSTAASLRTKGGRRHSIPSYSDAFRHGVMSDAFTKTSNKWWSTDSSAAMSVPSAEVETLAGMKPMPETAAGEAAGESTVGPSGTFGESIAEPQPMETGKEPASQGLEDSLQGLASLLERRSRKTEEALKQLLSKNKSETGMWMPVDDRGAAMLSYVFGDYKPRQWDGLCIT